MAAETQDIGKFLEISENLYEAAMAIAKRARQINEELFQKKRDRQILEELEGGLDEDFLQAEIEDGEESEVPEEDNPISKAQEEFSAGKLEIHYEPGQG